MNRLQNTNKIPTIEEVKKCVENMAPEVRLFLQGIAECTYRLYLLNGVSEKTAIEKAIDAMHENMKNI